VTTGVARFAQEAKNLVCRFSLPAAALRHQISETPPALFSSDEVKLNVHAPDVQPHGVERVALELLDRFFERRCQLPVSAHHQISGYQSSPTSL